MKNIIILCFSLCCGALFGQQGVDLRLISSPTTDAQFCYDLQLSYKGDEATLGSQNYRVFYNSESLKFDEALSKMHLRSDHYIFKVVQHNHGIDASGVGSLPFESNLGFINATIILNDPRLTGERIKEGSTWTPVIQLCFEELDSESPGNIVLARKQVTAAYGRAFIELSYIDASGAIESLPILSYTDINK